jgi:glycerophosphoryl diester phosphodiesterase
MDWIIAHRGGNIERPECTVAAIEYSANIGCTAAECDVRLTRDGALVVLHDPTLDRTTNGAGPVSEATLAEVLQLVAGQV